MTLVLVLVIGAMGLALWLMAAWAMTQRMSRLQAEIELAAERRQLAHARVELVQLRAARAATTPATQDTRGVHL